MTKINIQKIIKNLGKGTSISLYRTMPLVILAIVAACFEGLAVGFIYLVISDATEVSGLAFEYSGLYLRETSIYLLAALAITLNMVIQIAFTAQSLWFSQKTEKPLIKFIIMKLFLLDHSKELFQKGEAAKTTINKKVDIIVANVIFPGIMMFKNSMQVLILFIAVGLIGGLYAGAVFALIGIFYFVIAFSSKFMAKAASKELDTALGGIMYLSEDLADCTSYMKNSNNITEYMTELNVHVNKKIRAMVTVKLLMATPRYILETIVLMVIIILLVVYKTDEEQNLQHYTAILAACAIAGQKSVSSVQIIYQNFINFMGSISQLEDLEKYSVIEKGKTEYKQIPNADWASIKLNNCLIYIKDQRLNVAKKDTIEIKVQSLELKRGKTYGLFGESGSGKSTFVQALAGLNLIEGDILLDNLSISALSLSQEVILAQAGDRPNRISLAGAVKGLENYSDDIFEKFGLDDLIKYTSELDKVLDIDRFSSGQRQRLLLLRTALLQKSVIIFDEATNALDLKAEKKMMSAVRELCPASVLIIITHRPETLNICDKWLEIDNGILHNIKSISQLPQNSMDVS